MHQSVCPFCDYRGRVHEYRGAAKHETYRHFDESQICANLFEVTHDVALTEEC